MSVGEGGVFGDGGCLGDVRGFTVVELLITIAILGIMALISLSAIVNFASQSELTTATEDVRTALRDARTRTIAAESDSVHGVHIGTSSITTFVGSTYVPASSSNVTIDWGSGIFASTTLSIGGSDVVFKRLSGEADATGVVTLTETRSGATSTVTVHASGLAE